MSGFTHRLSSNASTVIVFVAAFGYLGYLASVRPDELRDQAPQVLLAAGALARLLYQVDEARTKATEAATVASESKTVSVDNADALATIATKVDENTAVTDTVHGAVNGQMAAFRQSVERTAQLEVQVVEIQSKLDAVLAHAEGVIEGRGQMTVASDAVIVEAPAVIHVVPPVEGAP